MRRRAGYANELAEFFRIAGPVPTPEVERALALAGDTDALVVRNLRLVVSIARHWQDRGLSLEELAAFGTLGLARAARKFDPSRGLKFSTMATYWINQAIQDAVFGAPLVRASVDVTRKANRWRAAERRLGPGAAPEAIGALLGLTPRRARGMAERQADFRGLPRVHRGPGWDDGDPLAEIVAPPEVERADPEETRPEVERALSCLDTRSAALVRGWYGIDGPPRTYAQLGRTFHLSHEAVRQQVERAVRRMRRVADRDDPARKRTG